MSDCRFEKYMLKLGPTRSGKGTVDKVLRQLLGDACGGFSLGHLSDTFGLSPLVGKRVAIIGEAHLEGRHNRTEILEKLKSIVGGDVQVINRKYREPLHCPLSVKFTISANEAPALYDCSAALTTRMLLLEFDHSFAGKEDTRLAEKLQTELPGIANWALAGRTRLLDKNGFTCPASSAETEAELMRESSVVIAFAQDRLEVDEKIKPSDTFKLKTGSGEFKVDKRELETEYIDWKHNTHTAGPSFPHFCKQLMQTLRGVKQYRPRVDGKQKNYLRGVRIRYTG